MDRLEAYRRILMFVSEMPQEYQELIKKHVNHKEFVVRGYENFMDNDKDYSAIDLSTSLIGIVTLTVGHWDLMDEHIKSIYDTYPYPKEFYIIPNIDYGMSLSAALNKGIKRALKDNCDYIVYSADDVVVGEDSIQTILKHLIVNNLWMVNAVGPGASGWDMFACSRQLFSEVGFFDEVFYPAYFEDNSFARRYTLISNNTKHAYINVDMVHKMSQTVSRMSPERYEQHQRDFRRCERLYAAMWGGPPGREIYSEPWNGSPPEEFEGIKIKLPEKWVETWPTRKDYMEFRGI